MFTHIVTFIVLSFLVAVVVGKIIDDGEDI